MNKTCVKTANRGTGLSQMGNMKEEGSAPKKHVVCISITIQTGIAHRRTLAKMASSCRKQDFAKNVRKVKAASPKGLSKEKVARMF